MQSLFCLTRNVIVSFGDTISSQNRDRNKLYGLTLYSLRSLRDWGTFLEAELPPETTGTKPRGKIPPNPLTKQLELANPVSYLG